MECTQFIYTLCKISIPQWRQPSYIPLVNDGCCGGGCNAGAGGCGGVDSTLYRVFNLKMDHILIWVIYLLRFTTCYITQLTCMYSKCWKWCPFISMHLSTHFTMFLVTFLSVLSFFNHFRNSTFYWRLPSKFFKETLSTVGVRHRF